MPSHLKQVPPATRGIQKIPVHKQKPVYNGFKKTIQSYFNCVVPDCWHAPPSSVFDSNDCIWYYGTVYVRESVAVEKIQGQQQQMRQMEEQHAQVLKEQLQHIQEMHDMQHVQNQAQALSHVLTQDLSQNCEYDDDDTESTTSGNGSGIFKVSRNIGKQNQLKYLKDGMRLRHLLLIDRATHERNEWFATFDAETNRIIRAQDGVAFDTLRQFARLHSNDVLSVDLASTNVWSDPNFQYQDDANGHWYPLSDLKK